MIVIRDIENRRELATFQLHSQAVECLHKNRPPFYGVRSLTRVEVTRLFKGQRIALYNSTMPARYGVLVEMVGDDVRL